MYGAVESTAALFGLARASVEGGTLAGATAAIGHDKMLADTRERARRTIG